MGFEICFDLQGVSHQDFRNGIRKIFPEEVKQGVTRISLPFPDSCGYIILNNPRYGVHGLQTYSSSLQSVRIAVYKFLTKLIDVMVPGPRAIIYDLYGYEDGALPLTSDPDYTIDVLRDFLYTKLIGDTTEKGSEMRFIESY
jgi:hypothetical protein